jgi:hypothetical protein
MREEEGLMIDFAQFWQAYPRRVGRLKAERIWRRMLHSEQRLAIDHLAQWKLSLQWQNTEFVPYGSTYLAQKRFLDEPWPHAFDEQRASESSA